MIVISKDSNFFRFAFPMPLELVARTVGEASALPWNWQEDHYCEEVLRFPATKLHHQCDVHNEVVWVWWEGYDTNA